MRNTKSGPIFCSALWLSHVPLFAPPCPTHCICQSPLSVGFSRQEYWSGLPFPPPRECPNPGIELSLLCLLHWQADSLPLSHQGSPFVVLSQFGSVIQSCPTLCDPMNRSTPGLPVHHQLLSSPKLMCIELVMPSSHLILCHPLFLLFPIPPSIRVFSNESTLRMRWSKYRSFSFSISPSNEHPGLISFRMDWLDLLAVQWTLKSLLQYQFRSINSSALSFLHSPTLTPIHDHWKNHSLD